MFHYRVPLSWTKCLQSTTSQPISRRCITTLSSQPRLGLPSGPFPSGFPTKIWRNSDLSRAWDMPHPYHSPWLNHPNNNCEAYKLWRSSLCGRLQPPTASSRLGPNILLSTLFSSTLNPRSSLSVWNKVLHSYKETRKIMCSFVYSYVLSF